MKQLFLVRHAQASLGADNYDQLSPLGHQQAHRLGEHWRALGLTFDAVITGTLVRHHETLAGILAGLAVQPKDLPHVNWAGLNEYDSEAVIATVSAGPLVKPTTPEGYKTHFRALREGLHQWMDGTTQPLGMPRYADFSAGVMAAFEQVAAGDAKRVLMVSSGGPISTAIGEIWGLDHATRIELNLRIRNTAVHELLVSARGRSIVSLNQIAHLETPEHHKWVTYA